MFAAVSLTAGALINLPASAAPAAPTFTFENAVTSSGETVSLSDFAGKTVVMEWTNDGCPFVKKHYAEPVLNMQTLQSDAATAETVWIQVISSAPGKQGYADAAKANQLNVDRGAAPAYTILDPEGVVGRAFGAKTTPHMFVFEDGGDLVYQGAIDSVRSAKVDDIAGATNYVTAALTSLEAGEEIAEAKTKAYGCSVKYAG